MCAAHLRQIGTAYALYANENGDLYPWAQLNYTPAGGAQQRIVTWDDLISRHLNVPLAEDELISAYAPRPAPIFMCPEDEVVREPYVVTLSPGQQNHPRSYGVTCTSALAGPDARFEGVSGQMAAVEPIPWKLIRGTLCVRRASVRAPSETILGFDMPSRTNNLGGFFAYAGRPYDQIVSFTGVDKLGRRGIHGRGYNYVFCDGHVELLEPQQTVRNGGSGEWYYQYNYMWTRNPRD